MAYITDEELKTYFASVLRHHDTAQIGDGFDVALPIENAKAYRKLRRKLLAKGYSAANIAAWDEGADYNRDLGVYYLLRSAAQLQADDTWPEKFNVLDELDDDGFALVVDGVVVDPEVAESDISFGTMTTYRDVAATFIGGDEE